MHRSATMAFACVLAAATAAYAAPPGAGDSRKGPGDRDRIICKSFARTGSLVETYRTCKTRAEWNREQDNIRQFSVSDSCRDRANGGSLCG